MNRENLQKMADYIKTVPQSKFDMKLLRSGEFNSMDNYFTECSSVGCVIGHCTILDPEPDKIPRDHNNDIYFIGWSEQFTGLDPDSNEWEWCFSGGWFNTDNTPLGASKRIEWLLQHGLPQNWKKQFMDEDPLCYE